jgi:hypothetical protein
MTTLEPFPPPPAHLDYRIRSGMVAVKSAQAKKSLLTGIHVFGGG